MWVHNYKFYYINISHNAYWGKKFYGSLIGLFFLASINLSCCAFKIIVSPLNVPRCLLFLDATVAVKLADNHEIKLTAHRGIGVCIVVVKCNQHKSCTVD